MTQKTAIYVRVSVLKEEAVSPQMQLDKARQYCKLHDENFEVFQDLDFSGKDTNRPAFQQMLSRIRMGLISKLVVYRLDRVSRSVKDLALFMDMLKERNVEFYSITEQFDTSTPMGRAMINIMAVFAQMEREVISQRILDTKAKQKADGVKLGMPPYGYRLRVRMRCEWEIVPHEARIVKKVFQMYSTGKWSYKSIATFLNHNFKKDIKRLPGQSHRGGAQYARYKWQPYTVNCILRNMSYTGVVDPNAGLIARNFKPIIPYELYRRCEEIREKRSPGKMQYSHATRFDDPMKGKLFCSCGWPMGIRSDRKPKIFYFCRNFHKGTHSHHANKFMLLRDILEYIMSCKLDPDIVKKAKQQIQGNSAESELERMKIVNRLRQSYERLQEQYVDGEISKSFLNRKTAEIELKLKEFQPKIGSSSRVAILDSIPDIINRLNIQNLEDSWKYREKIIGLFVEKVVWDKDHISSLKIYDEFRNFFPAPYQPRQEVSAIELIKACEGPKPTIYQIRTWNFLGLLPDTGRPLGKGKRYCLKEGKNMAEEIMRLLKLGYSLEEIGKLFKGEPVLVRRGIIAKKLGVEGSKLGYWLEKLAKPAAIKADGTLLYEMEKTINIIKDSKVFQNYQKNNELSAISANSEGK